jgi:hypothetical protein
VKHICLIIALVQIVEKCHCSSDTMLRIKPKRLEKHPLMEAHGKDLKGYVVVHYAKKQMKVLMNNNCQL